ncbi:hypothetical protein ACT4S2_17190 [Kocuria turfanensis]|uniref:hypothetical protein n=1 Tax=Kocuria turfanensis TaxID=388357 RepID=UPI004035ADCF
MTFLFIEWTNRYNYSRVMLYPVLLLTASSLVAVGGTIALIVDGLFRLTGRKFKLSLGGGVLWEKGAVEVPDCRPDRAGLMEWKQVDALSPQLLRAWKAENAPFLLKLVIH